MYIWKKLNIPPPDWDDLFVLWNTAHWPPLWTDLYQLPNWPALGAPPFSPRACGTPREWNTDVPITWSRRTKNHPWFQPINGATVSHSLMRVQDFLRGRPGPDGHPILDKIEYRGSDHGWHKFEWKDFIGTHNLPSASPGPYNNGHSDWHRAWHGCKLEALYSIMYQGKLLPSDNPDRGQRFHPGRPGVYVHKDGTCYKTLGYSRFTPLCQDGVFWAAIWEVYVDRADRIRSSYTDQWIQPERSVHIAALWLAGCRYEDLPTGMEVTALWIPTHEAHPLQS